MSERKIRFEGGPLHGTTTVLRSYSPVYYYPYLPRSPSFGTLDVSLNDLPCSAALEYRAVDRYACDVPVEGQDAQVYELSYEDRIALLPRAVYDLGRSSMRAFERLLPADLLMLDRIVWTALRRARS